MPTHVLITLSIMFTSLFAFRIVAEPLSLATAHPALPAFEAWQSGTLSYPVLLTAQVAILFMMLLTTHHLVTTRNRRHPMLGQTLSALGILYFITMATRLLLGFIWLTDHFWFGKILPAIFHLVLACWLMTVGSLTSRYR